MNTTSQPRISLQQNPLCCNIIRLQLPAQNIPVVTGRMNSLIPGGIVILATENSGVGGS